MTRITVTGESNVLWTIRERGYDSMGYVVATFGGSTANMMAYCEPAAARSIFDGAAIHEVYRVFNWTTQELTTVGSDGRR